MYIFYFDSRVIVKLGKKIDKGYEGNVYLGEDKWSTEKFGTENDMETKRGGYILWVN